MTEQPVGPRCGNNPNVRLTTGDREAVDNFKARLALQASAKSYIDNAAWVDGDPLMEVIAATLWKHCARDDEDMPQAVCDDPRTIAAFAAAVARAQADALSSVSAVDQTTRDQAALARVERLALTFEVSGNEFIAEQIRAAVGARQPDTETQAHPPQHAWRVETRDPLANQWAPGSHFAHRPAALERWETANRNAPLWRDGTPVERRIVRETTTYTVEVEHQPAASSAVPGRSAATSTDEETQTAQDGAES